MGAGSYYLDEAQRIENWKTRMAQSVKRLKSPYAMVLTGTRWKIALGIAFDYRFYRSSPLRAAVPVPGPPSTGR